MKIKNYDGRSWISKYYGGEPVPTIHITNAEVESVELKGQQLVITVVTKQPGKGKGK